MKKKMRIIALVLVVAVAIIGAGYAAWGTSIVDKTYINTGVFEVVLEDDAPDSMFAGDEVRNFRQVGTGYEDSGRESADNLTGDGIYDQNVDGNLDSNDDSGYDVEDSTQISGAKKEKGTNAVFTIQPVINETKDQVTFKFYNMHPGTIAYTTLEMRNIGSIGAKVSNIKVSVKGKDGEALRDVDKELRNAIRVSGNFEMHNYYSGHPDHDYVPLGNFSNITLGELEDEIEAILVKDTVILQPKTAITTPPFDCSELEITGLSFSIPAEALGGNKGMNASVEVSIRFDFVQYNQLVGPEVTPEV